MRRHCLVAVLLVAACSKDPIPAEVRAQVNGISEAIAPGLPQFESVDGPMRLGSSVTAAWRFPLTQPWPEYLDGLVPRLGARGFHLTHRGDQSATFVQARPGDVFSLVLLVEASGTPIRVHATFTAGPD